MGQIHVTCDRVKPIINTGSMVLETETLIKSSEDEKPPDPRPSQKNFFSARDNFAQLKLREHRAGGHPLVMVSCIH